MALMAEEIGTDCSNQSDCSNDHWFDLSNSLRLQRDSSWSILKFFNADSSSISGGAAIGVRGVSGHNASVEVNVQSGNFMDMNRFEARSARGGSRPGADRKIFGFDNHGPLGIQLNDIRPADREIFDGIANDHSLVAEDNFGANQKEIDAGQDKYSSENAGDFACSTTLVEIGPNEESVHHDAGPGDDQGGFRAIGFDVRHSSSISHQSSMACDSIKAVY